MPERQIVANVSPATLKITVRRYSTLQLPLHENIDDDNYEEYENDDFLDEKCLDFMIFVRKFLENSDPTPRPDSSSRIIKKEIKKEKEEELC